MGGGSSSVFSIGPGPGGKGTLSSTTGLSSFLTPEVQEAREEYEESYQESVAARAARFKGQYGLLQQQAEDEVKKMTGAAIFTEADRAKIARLMLKDVIVDGGKEIRSPLTFSESFRENVRKAFGVFKSREPQNGKAPKEADKPRPFRKFRIVP